MSKRGARTYMLNKISIMMKKSKSRKEQESGTKRRKRSLKKVRVRKQCFNEKVDGRVLQVVNEKKRKMKGEEKLRIS